MNYYVVDILDNLLLMYSYTKKSTFCYMLLGNNMNFICSEDCPSHDEAVLRMAKELYHDHNDLTCTNDHCWDLCSREYQQAWLLIAKTTLL